MEERRERSRLTAHKYAAGAARLGNNRVKPRRNRVTDAGRRAGSQFGEAAFEGLDDVPVAVTRRRSKGRLAAKPSVWILLE